ncbi:MAG TPA: hypothetical protein VK738_00455 [Terriglobales bacterium]|nr:hypothetical protein [Terriglobales bacterium]
MQQRRRLARLSCGACPGEPWGILPTRLNKGEVSEVVTQLCKVGDFVRRLRTQLRFGALSRAPLCLLRLELKGVVAECEWVARPPDPWDADLPRAVGEHNASLQALEDAMAVRQLLFYLLPGVESAVFRVYRQSTAEAAELIITGEVTREEPNLRVLSLAMRAKLCGFHFWLAEGTLETLQPEEYAISNS